MPPTPYPAQITATITYTATVHLPPSSLAQLFALGLPIIEDLTPAHVTACTISTLRHYLRLYDCTTTLRRPRSKPECLAYFARLLECRPPRIPLNDPIHPAIRDLVAGAILTPHALALGKRVVHVANFLSADACEGSFDEDFVRFAEVLAGMCHQECVESGAGLFHALSGFGESRCLKLARASCSTGCAQFDRMSLYE